MLPEDAFAFSARGYMDFAIQLQCRTYERSERAFARWEAHKDGLTTPDAVRQWQAHIRAVAEEAVGGLLRLDAPLNPRTCGEVEGEGFRVERIIFESLPGYLVTCALYLPEATDTPGPAVLFVCGHSAEAKGAAVYQAVCQRLARNGLVVLAMDPPGQGERFSYIDEEGRQRIGSCTPDHDQAGLQCWLAGRSIARYFIRDAMRAIDLLQQRPEVDPDRIGLTGNSGGGTQSTWLMMLEPRIRAAAPGCFVMRRREYMWTGQAQDSEQIIPGGTARGLDHEDFLIAMAPRPAMVLSAEYDYFCIEGALATVQRARRIYRLLGAPDALRMATVKKTHGYAPELARAATAFFCEVLLGKEPDEVDHSEPEPLDPADLWCTPEGQLLLEDPTTPTVFHLNRDEHVRTLQARPAPERRACREVLSEHVLAHREPCELRPRWVSEREGEGAVARSGFWFTEPFLCNAGFLFKPTEDFRELIVALFHDGNRELETRSDWIEARLAAGAAVLAVDVRGEGLISARELNPTGLHARYGTLYKLTSDLVCLGDDLASGRVYDVLRALELARTDPAIGLEGRPIRLCGFGLGGYYAYLAGALDENLPAAEIEDAPFSMESVLRTRFYEYGRTMQAVIFGMLQHFDLPDLLPLYEGRELIIRRPRGARGEILSEHMKPSDDSR